MSEETTTGDHRGGLTPPRNRTSDVQVNVEPASAATPRPGPTTPSAKEVEAAVEQSAEFLAQQAAPPSDAHPKPTTPSKAEVEEAVEQSAQFLQMQGVDTDVAPTETRDKGVDASPVSAGGTNPGLDAAPVYAGRDKTADASPVFSAPVPDKPAE